MTEFDGNLIDWSVYTKMRGAMGPDFVRILGYFREDGVKSVSQIEQAMRDKDAAKLVFPAHTLKGDALQLGATHLAETAENIELVARKCLEHHEQPDELLELVVSLRSMFEQTISELDNASSPVVQRGTGGFGRRSTSFSAQPSGKSTS